MSPGVEFFSIWGYICLSKTKLIYALILKPEKVKKHKVRTFTNAFINLIRDGNSENKL